MPGYIKLLLACIMLIPISVFGGRTVSVTAMPDCSVANCAFYYLIVHNPSTLDQEVKVTWMASNTATLVAGGLPYSSNEFTCSGNTCTNDMVGSVSKNIAPGGQRLYVVSTSHGATLNHTSGLTVKLEVTGNKGYVIANLKEAANGGASRIEINGGRPF